MPRRSPTERPESLPEGPMNYAPENEMGVVFLFAHLAKRWRLQVEEIKPGYPDCVAYQKAHGKERRVRIEFEYKSRNFKIHRHDAKKCDWIVCWEHNWGAAPRRLKIVELRREFGLGFNVWIMPVIPDYQEDLDVYPSVDWSAPAQAHKGDLILFYYTGGKNKCFKYIYRCEERAYFVRKANWKKRRKEMKRKSEHRAYIRRIGQLKAPVFLDDLRANRILSTAGFVRADMRGSRNATEYWPYLYKLITARNPSLREKLKRYSPNQF
jgi:hypothetical protein